MTARVAAGHGATDPRLLFLALGALLLAGLATELMTGAVALAPGRVLRLLSGAASSQLEMTVLWNIRAPRAVLAIGIGGALGFSGAALQGLFRNPLADPSLIGVSSGAALAAVAAIVLGPAIAALVPFLPAMALVPVCAFSGGLVATLLVLRLARTASGGEGDTGALLLAGIAVNAICVAGTGLLISGGDDRALRDIVFWTLGSLGSTGWSGAGVCLFGLACAAGLLLPVAHALDALLLGEREAAYLGIQVARLRRRVVLATALAVGAAVAMAGVIGFVGLVVPHLIRLSGVTRHAIVLPAAALLGAALMLFADATCRVIMAPVELPVGLLTSALGGPFFVMLLARRQRGAG